MNPLYPFLKFRVNYRPPFTSLSSLCVKGKRRETNPTESPSTKSLLILFHHKNVFFLLLIVNSKTQGPLSTYFRIRPVTTENDSLKRSRIS